MDAAAAAEGLEGRFEVRSADLELQGRRLSLERAPAIADRRYGAARTGGRVPLSLQVELDIERVRQLLPNSRVAELTQRYHLQYNAVSARYILRNDNSGQQESLGTIDEAIEHLSEVHSLPVLDKALITAGPALRGERAREARFRFRALHAAVSDVLGQRLAP